MVEVSAGYRDWVEAIRPETPDLPSLRMLIRCAEIVWDSNMESIILTGGVSQRIVARICGEVRLVWPKTGFRSSRTPARRKRMVIRRRVVRDADMA